MDEGHGVVEPRADDYRCSPNVPKMPNLATRVVFIALFDPLVHSKPHLICFDGVVILQGLLPIHVAHAVRQKLHELDGALLVGPWSRGARNVEGAPHSPAMCGLRMVGIETATIKDGFLALPRVPIATGHSLQVVFATNVNGPPHRETT